MSIEANKAAVRSYFEQLLNRGDIGAADAIFASEVQIHYLLGDLSGTNAITKGEGEDGGEKYR